MKYPILISDLGKQVDLLEKKKTAATFTNYSAAGQTATMPSKELCKAAEVLAEHSGFVVGATVRIKDYFSPDDAIRKILRYKDVNSEQVWWYYKHKQENKPEDVALILLAPGKNQSVPIPYAIEELELLSC